MTTITYRSLIALLFAAAISLFTSSCGITLSPVKRAPLAIAPMNTSVVSKPEKVVVRFEDTLATGPLAETVWDNSGPFIDDKESQQIGFTQNYSTMIPAAALGGAGAGAAVATSTNYTRLVIPFGRLFEGVFQSGLEKAFPNSRVCLDDSCEQKAAGTSMPVVKLKVTEFKVWEHPLNHLNLKATVECQVYRGNTSKPTEVFNVQHEVTEQSIGSVMSTSGGFVKNINKLSNDFAGAVSEEILEKLK